MPEIRTFEAPGAARPIQLNLSATEMVVFDHLSGEALLSVVEEHERLRIAEFWDTKLLRPSGDGQWVEGLDNKKGANGQPGPAYLTSRALQAIAGSHLWGVELVSSLRGMSLEEQRASIRRHLPATRSEAKKFLRDLAPAFAPDFRAMLAEAGNPAALITKLVNALRTNSGAPQYHPARYMELLTLLWAKGYLLFPLDLRDWRTAAKWATLTNPIYSSRTEAIEEARIAMKLFERNETMAILYGFFGSSAVAAAADLSPALIDAYEQRMLELIVARNPDDQTYRYHTTNTAYTLRMLHNAAHPANPVALVRSRATQRTQGPLRTDGTFRWLAQTRPDLTEWADALRDYVAQLTTGRIGTQITKLNHLADFLVSLEAPLLCPAETVRSVHIYDASLANGNTFFEYLRRNVSNKQGRATSMLKEAREFFDWYADFLIASKDSRAASFRNPVLSSDSLGSRRRDAQTSRNALPSYILQELKSVLTEGDFAFGKGLPRHWVRLIDGHTGQPTRVWFPGLTVCLYLMLEAPLRSHQARWLDSGHLDEQIYDPAVNRCVPNPSSHAIRGRREGVLRVQHDSLRKADWLGLWVNTNKTALYDVQDVGYLIPFVSDTLAQLLTLMQGWQARYQPPLARPIPYYHEGHGMEERKRLESKGPQVAPLFLDPSGHVSKRTPLSYDKLAVFYTTALAEVQDRIKRKHNHDIQLVTRDGRGKLHWKVDLHSLRVSGITAMIESGVPLEVVSQFVAGHATLVMTLHYLKYSPLKIRKLLADAHERSLESMDFVGSEVFMEHLDSFAPFLLGQEGAGVGPGMGALREKSGILTITSDGICPGTSCSSGGPPESANQPNGPVPGGQRCGLCRYWITGPAHLLGQVAAVNNLAYVIRKKGLEVAELNDARLEAEDEGNQRKARELRDRVDLLNRELAIDLEEWAARYRYAEQSTNLLNQYLAARAKVDGSKVPVPLLTAGSAAELKVTLEEAHEFALLDQITQTSEFVTGFKNREAELEKNTILSRMMAANGITPFLLTLSDQQAHEAANLLSAMLLQQVKSQELSDVLTGRKPLDEYPRLAAAVNQLQAAVDSGKLDSTFTLAPVSLPTGSEYLVLDDEQEEGFA